MQAYTVRACLAVWLSSGWLTRLLGSWAHVHCRYLGREPSVLYCMENGVHTRMDGYEQLKERARRV